MRIYTRTGDRGETGLLGGGRVGKDHLRITAIGEVDELNAAIGWLRGPMADRSIDPSLDRIQILLFEIGMELASPSRDPDSAFATVDVAWIEKEIDRLEESLSPLSQFVLPGGSEAGARAHIARCVCRRAERSVVALLRAEPSQSQVLAFLNRLSDFLFVLARWANRRDGAAETTWTPRADRGEPGGAEPTA